MLLREILILLNAIFGGIWDCFAHIHNLPFLPFLKTQILTLICTSVANLVDCPGLLGCNTNDLDYRQHSSNFDMATIFNCGSFQSTRTGKYALSMGHFNFNFTV